MSEDRQTIEIRRLLAESDKFVAEQRKLMAESQKLYAEQQKLDKERWWFPYLQVITAIAALIAAIGVIFHH